MTRATGDVHDRRLTSVLLVYTKKISRYFIIIICVPSVWF